MEIELKKSTEFTVITESKVITEKLTILELVDLPLHKIVLAKTQEVGQLVLWKDDAYDAIGQWTDTDVINKINELYGN